MLFGFRSPTGLRRSAWPRIVLAAAAVVSLATGGLALAATQGTAAKGGLKITKKSWGQANGQPVALYTLSNSHGMQVKITNYGGVVQSIWVRDRNGKLK